MNPADQWQLPPDGEKARTYRLPSILHKFALWTTLLGTITFLTAAVIYMTVHLMS